MTDHPRQAHELLEALEVDSRTAATASIGVAVGRTVRDTWMMLLVSTWLEDGSASPEDVLSLTLPVYGVSGRNPPPALLELLESAAERVGLAVHEADTDFLVDVLEQETDRIITELRRLEEESSRAYRRHLRERAQANREAAARAADEALEREAASFRAAGLEPPRRDRGKRQD